MKSNKKDKEAMKAEEHQEISLGNIDDFLNGNLISSSPQHKVKNKKKDKNKKEPK
jgi:hypothetical protein